MSRGRATRRAAAQKSQATRKAGASPIVAPSSTATVASIVSSASRPLEMEWYWALYSKHPFVNSCVCLIADAVAEGGYAIVPPDGEEQSTSNEDSRVSELNLWLRKFAFPNSSTPRALNALAKDLLVYAVGYWRKKRVAAGGVLLGLERLDPRRVTVKLNADQTVIESYLLRKKAPLIGWDGMAPEVIPAKDVVMFTMGGGDPVFGDPSPLEALDISIAMDWAIRKHNEAFFRNGAVAGRTYIIKNADESQYEDAKKQIRRKEAGTDNAYLSKVLAGDWDVVEAAESGHNELNFTKGSEICRDEIFAVYKVPPGKLFMQQKGLGQAGKAQDDDTFQRDAVLPLERAIYEVMTRRLVQEEFLIDDLEFRPRRLDQIRLDRMDAASKLVMAGGTGNESRALMNLPPVDDADGDLDMNIPLFLGSRNPVADNSAQPGTGDPALEQEDELDDTLDEQTDNPKRKKTPKPKSTETA